MVLRRPFDSTRYAAGPYRQVLERHGIRRSMSRRGNCLDNAPMESFFASLKKERVHHARFRTRAEARAAVFEYIEVFYRYRQVGGWSACRIGSGRIGRQDDDSRPHPLCRSPLPT